MESQYEMIGGKTKQTFKKRGEMYTRKGYDIKVELAKKFTNKCHVLGESESHIIGRFIEAFCWANGWGPEVKHPPFFETNSNQHIKQAVKNVLKDMFPWTSEN